MLDLNLGSVGCFDGVFMCPEYSFVPCTSVT